MTFYGIPYEPRRNAHRTTCRRCPTPSRACGRCGIAAVAAEDRPRAAMIAARVHALGCTRSCTIFVHQMGADWPSTVVNRYPDTRVECCPYDHLIDGGHGLRSWRQASIGAVVSRRSIAVKLPWADRGPSSWRSRIGVGGVPTRLRGCARTTSFIALPLLGKSWRFPQQVLAPPSGAARPRATSRA